MRCFSSISVALMIDRGVIALILQQICALMISLASDLEIGFRIFFVTLHRIPVIPDCLKHLPASPISS